MLDGLSLDQLRTFLAAVDEGSFSAAGRRLGRAQSVVSQTIANLEEQLRLKLFDRRARLPELTQHGRAIVERARGVVQDIDGLRAYASELAGGVEPQLSIAVDAMFPTDVLTRSVTAFRTRFPNTPLRVYVDALGALLELVADHRCVFAITGTLPLTPAKFTVDDVVYNPEVVFAASSRHPLARYKGRIPAKELHKHVQLVLSDRSKLTEGQEYGVSPGAVWRLADFGAKLAFLRAGLGWGGVPHSLVRSELDNGKLVVLDVREILGMRSPPHMMPMRPVYDPALPPGPAGRWLIQNLRESGMHEEPGRQARSKRARP